MQQRQWEWVTLPSGQSCMLHYIVGIAGEKLMSSIRLTLLKTVKGASHSVHSWCWLMTITRSHIYRPWVSSKELQWCKPQWLCPQSWIQHPAWHWKYTPEDTKHIKIQNSGRLNSERETYMWRTHGIIGISLKRHLRWRLLLHHSGKANNTSRVPWCQQWWQNHIMLTWCCWKPHQGGGHVNHWEKR